MMLDNVVIIIISGEEKMSIGEASLMAFAICMVLIQDRHNHHHSNDHNESSNCYGPNDLITIIDISQRHEHQDLWILLKP